MTERIEDLPEIPEETEAWTSRNFLRKCYEHSPWLTISVLLHVLIFTMLAIVRPDKSEKLSFTPVSFGSAQEVPTPLAEPPPEIVDRTVPAFEEDPEGVFNDDPNYIPQAEAGRISEVTEDVDYTKDPGEFNPDPEATWDKPSGATGGTAIGAGVTGHTGTTSAYSSRRRGGGGAGGGGGGQGGKGGRGGSKAEDAVNNALIWLRNHQSLDGHWDSAHFAERCKGVPCDGPGQSAHDTGVTGLALLCFLGADMTHQEGYYKQTVKNGLKYLIDHQDEEGCFGDRVSKSFLYDHACATLAMTEAYGMTKARAFLKPAQQGVNFILKAQNPYSAWRYSAPPDGDNDTSVTGWMIMVLKSAAMSDLKIDEQAYANAMNFITEMTDPDTGRTGYTDRGSAPSRLTELMQLYPAERSESLTAVGMLVRIFSHLDPKDPMIEKGADLCAAKVPMWETSTGDIDFYYWYYATLAMFQVGGPRWTKWNEALKVACIDHQRMKKEECAFGSWDAIDPWSSAGGRVYSTAMNCLCMEVYYRYPRVFGASGK
jgi:hypothetical protein